MASKYVEDTIEGHLEANWTLSPILTENMQGSTPEDGSPFLRLQFPVADVGRWAVDQRYYREEGGFRIIIAVENGSGTAKIRDWGAQLAALFRDKKIGDVITLAPSEPFTDDASNEGNYFVGSMVVPYTYDFHG